MGTVATLTVSGDDTRRIKEYASACRRILSDLEGTFSIFVPASDISRLNLAAGREWVPVSAHTQRILELSIFYSRLSGGCFDVTVGPLVKAWGFSGGKRPDKPPDAEIIRQIMKRVGWEHLALSNNAARLDAAAASVDLGGIAKGYAVETEGLTKPLFVLGVSKSMPLLAQAPCSHALFIPDGQPVRILVTPGFSRQFTPERAFADKIVGTECADVR